MHQAWLILNHFHIIVTWPTTPEGGTSSFPIETPGCPTDPADVREAGQVTTTLAQP